MPAYLVAVYRCPSRANAEQVQANFDPGDFSVAEYDTEIHDTPPVVLSGLVKGGVYASEVEWESGCEDLCVDASGRIATGSNIRPGKVTYPLTWYRYEEP